VARHVVLLGDSIFDNGAYTRGDPDVVSHLRTLLPARWRATLCAVDGATTRTLRGQIARTPDDASHVVLAVGGNDALQHIDLLDLRVASTAEALDIFAARVEEFEADYRAALESVVALGRPTIVCTIYNGNLEPPRARIARTALAIFNDAIVRSALERELPLIDLRLVCSEPADYANPIEPSGAGGRKVAAAVVSAVRRLSGV
jgi:hypothetical protein